MYQVERVSRNQKTNKWGQTRQFVVFSDDDGREWKSMWNVLFDVVRRDEAGRRAAAAVSPREAIRRQLQRALSVEDVPNLADRLRSGDRFSVEAGAVEFDGEWASIRRPRGAAVVIRVGGRAVLPATEARRVRGPFTSRKGNTFFMGTTLQGSKWRSTLIFPATADAVEAILRTLDCGVVMLTGRISEPSGSSRNGVDRFMMFDAEPQLAVEVAPAAMLPPEIDPVTAPPVAPVEARPVVASGRGAGLEIYSDEEIAQAKAQAEAHRSRGLLERWEPSVAPRPARPDSRFSMLELG